MQVVTTNLAKGSFHVKSSDKKINVNPPSPISFKFGTKTVFHEIE